MTHVRLVPAIAAAFVLTGFLVTINRVPAPRNESQLYASIARAEQLSGTGVPSVLWASTFAVDHIPFYGPVYFSLQALVFRIFGVTVASSRLLSLLGVLLIAAGGGMLASRLGHWRDRWIWAAALLLLTPEVGTAATRGDMEPLAVGFEIMALAVFAGGHGASAGLCLSLAALTTPRTYPFVVAFLLCGTGFYIRRRSDPGRRQFIRAAAIVLASLSIWGFVSFGSPVRWARFMAFVLSHEDTDVAIAGTATRYWQFSWSLAITPIAASVGAFVAAMALGRREREPDAASRARFVLMVSALGGVLTFALMNLTFLWGGYFALPLFAVILAWPSWELPSRSKHLVITTSAISAVCALLACDLGAAALRYVRVAATWAARDPRPVEQLIRTHVPQGSAVYGPDWLYFFAVEGNGARYLAVSEHSVADWARWVPLVNPQTVYDPTPLRRPRYAERFLIWPVIYEHELPERYACVRDQLIATYRPPAQYLDRLGRFGEVSDAGYPETLLYRLPRGCPIGSE